MNVVQASLLLRIICLSIYHLSQVDLLGITSESRKIDGQIQSNIIQGEINCVTELRDHPCQ